MKTLFKLFFAVFSMLFMAAVFSTALDAPVADVLAVMTVFSLVLFAVRVIFFIKNPADYGKRHTGAAYGVAIEFWEQTVAEFLLREYNWIMRAKDRTANVLDGAVVHIPQAGALPGGRRNRKNYPAPITRRFDTDITYVIDEVSTNPSHIKHAEKVELTYDKVASVFNDHIKQLNFLAAYNILFRWAGKNPVAGGVTNLDLNAANIIRTTGSAVATHLSGATGNRQVMTLGAFNLGKTAMINQTKREINTGKRALIIDETMYNQLRADSALDTFDKRDLAGVQMQGGDMVRIGGFDIIRTDVLPRFNNAGVPIAKDPISDDDVNLADGSLNPYQNTAASTDNACALLVDFDFVHFAKGPIEVFETTRDAVSQGDIYSALTRIGASRERVDQAGVVAIVQQP
jgi:hypothetical protein